MKTLLNHLPNSKSVLFVLLLSFILTACKVNKTNDQNEYSSYIEKTYQSGQLNGNVIVIESGKVVYSGSYGENGSDERKQLDENTVFRLASIGKQFTAMGIMILEERGLLSFDQDINEFFPELPYKGITIRHLLNHVSGLPDYVGLMDREWKPGLSFNDPAKLISGNEDIIQMFVMHKPEVKFKPGEKWEYSNTAYVFLASIIERISEQSFADFMKVNVFVPAGMENTLVYYYNPLAEESVPNRAYGFYISGDTIVSVDFHYVNRAAGDGGTFSTIFDLAKWDRVLYTEKLVKSESLEKAFTKVVLNNGDTIDYGFGWGIKTTSSGGRVVEHSGGWAGFRTYIYRETGNENCIILLTNNSNRYMRETQEELIGIMQSRKAELRHK